LEAGRAAGDVPAAQTPGGRITAGDRVGIAPQSQDFRAEGVQPVSARDQRPHDLLDLACVLASAHGAYSEQWQRGEIDAVSFVHVSAAVVVRDGLSLQDGDDRQIGRQLAQPEIFGDGALLVDAYRCPGTRQDVRLRHVVHRRGPVEVADLGGVAAQGGDVGVFVGAPSAVQG
jgi:hypothetical protein